MKKSIFKLFAGITMLLMAFSLAACGGNKEKDPMGMTDGKYNTVEGYVASDEVQKELASLKDTLASSGLNMEVTGKDNKLIYTYTYQDITKSDELADTLAEQMETQADMFRSVATSIKEYVNEETPIVVVEYLDSNGELIYSAEFESEAE